MNIAGVILAGGYSTRMGDDKVSLSIGHKTMLERAIACIEHAHSDICDIYISCRKESPPHTTYPLLYDSFHGIGPISGIYSALHSLQRPCLFLPIDIPAMKPHFLAQLIDVYKTKEDEGIEMVCFQSEGGIIEALVSLFSPNAVNTIRKSIEQGIYKITHTLSREKQYYIQYTEQEYTFYNVNTPLEFREITQYIENHEETFTIPNK
ncbi:MAG: molybdenum cofactor guanylyltransferase [Desulfovibrionaceae bacterium]|nr:molybdenum cofactor guanylyltransferase [Desulfovibrionaceae bacterium]